MYKFFVKTFAILKWLFFVLLLVFLSFYFILHGSLADLSGQLTMSLLDKPVVVERDRQGVPTISAQNRIDTAFALGYVHAQERYFQMDLLRRSASGELAELFGRKALKRDEKVRIHRFRERVQKQFRHLPGLQTKIIQAYTNGVNSGLDNLSGNPLAYIVLGKEPRDWAPEDSLLCAYAMFLDLNDASGIRETSLTIMREQLPEAWYRFLTPQGGQWDAPMDNSVSTTPLVIPDSPLPKQWLEYYKKEYSQNTPYYQKPGLPGSNSFAVDSTLTSHDSAMLANDMHLNLRVPNIWFRASWYLPDGRRLTGITLPGTPVMIAGSNENIAWGFTNSFGDWGDIITLQTNPEQTRYKTPDGWQDFSIHNQEIAIRGGKPEKFLSIETIWGPVIGKNHKGEMLVHQWLAYAPQAVNLNFINLEQAESVSDALDIAPYLGMPSQNLLVADKNGTIGWTIAGMIPQRKSDGVGSDHALHQSVWNGFLPPENYPRLINPDDHRLWTANNRLFGGKIKQIIGDQGGDLGARAQQVRDDLKARKAFQESDFLAIQLDFRALFLQRWKTLLRTVIGDSDITAFSRMAEILDAEEKLQASSESVAYGLVRDFRNTVVEATIGWLFDALEKQYPQWFLRSKIDNKIEYPVWALISQKPEHLIPPGYPSWEEFLLAMAHQAYNKTTDNGEHFIQQQSWGQRYKIDIRHPLSGAIPGLGFFLDMPKDPLSGDDNMPKVLKSHFGATMRMVVSPGHEADGIFHMPTGQSGHPLSSYYSRGHEDWVKGRPTPFLPGETEWTLTLKSIE